MIQYKVLNASEFIYEEYMNIAFYNAVVGAQQQQKRLDVISNNISNINTDGYRNQKATFTDMLYSNIHDLSLIHI